MSVTTLLCLMKSKPMIGTVIFFNTTKCSANVMAPISNLGVASANGFSNCPFANCF